MTFSQKMAMNTGINNTNEGATMHKQSSYGQENTYLEGEWRRRKVEETTTKEQKPPRRRTRNGGAAPTKEKEEARTEGNGVAKRKKKSFVFFKQKVKGRAF